MDLIALKEILFNVNHLCSHIEISRKELKKISFDNHPQVHTDIDRLLNIYICSLLDELKIFEKYAKSENNFFISDTLYVLTPLINYIKKFDSLRIRRNKILAHHNRNRKNEFSPWWKELIGKRFATSNEEERMIFSIIKSMHSIFKKRFPDELSEAITEYNKEIDLYENHIMNTPNVEPNNDITPTIIEVQKRMKERDFEFTIMSKK